MPEITLNDTELLNALEILAQNEGYRLDLIICYDKEDGFFLASVENGRRHPWPIKDLQTDRRRHTLREALIAAIEWHNAEAKKLNHSFMKAIPIGEK